MPTACRALHTIDCLALSACTQVAWINFISQRALDCLKSPVRWQPFHYLRRERHLTRINENANNSLIKQIFFHPSTSRRQGLPFALRCISQISVEELRIHPLGMLDYYFIALMTLVNWWVLLFIMIALWAIKCSTLDDFYVCISFSNSSSCREFIVAVVVVVTINCETLRCYELWKLNDIFSMACHGSFSSMLILISFCSLYVEGNFFPLANSILDCTMMLKFKIN